MKEESGAEQPTAARAREHEALVLLGTPEDLPPSVALEIQNPGGARGVCRRSAPVSAEPTGADTKCGSDLEALRRSVKSAVSQAQAIVEKKQRLRAVVDGETQVPRSTIGLPPRNGRLTELEDALGAVHGEQRRVLAPALHNLESAALEAAQRAGRTIGRETAT